MTNIFEAKTKTKIAEVGRILSVRVELIEAGTDNIFITLPAKIEQGERYEGYVAN